MPKKRGRPFTMAEGKTCAIKIPVAWEKQLEKMAEKEDTTKSTLVRRALKDFYKFEMPTPTQAG